MIEFCSTIVCSISLDHRGPLIRSWSSRESMIWSICSIIGAARSCSTIIEYTRASWIMTDHSTHLSDCVILLAYTKGVYRHTRYQFFRPDFTPLVYWGYNLGTEWVWLGYGLDKEILVMFCFCFCCFVVCICFIVLVDSRVLTGHSGSCGGFLHVARVVLSRCTVG